MCSECAVVLSIHYYKLLKSTRVHSGIAFTDQMSDYVDYSSGPLEITYL